MDDEELLEYAKKARENAYAPYSGYSVGAAVLTDDGKVYCGCNIENASFGATVCAERTAVFKAVSEGSRHVCKVAIAGSTDSPAWPCGICRQVLAEFAAPKLKVITQDAGKIVYVSLDELLPYAFTAQAMDS